MKNKICEYGLILLLAIVFLCSAVLILTRPVFSMDLAQNTYKYPGSYLEHNVVIDNGLIYYNNQDDNRVELIDGVTNFLTQVELPHLPFGVYKYDVHYSSNSEWLLSVLATCDNYDDFYAEKSGLWDYKSSTWSYIDVCNLNGVDGLVLNLVAEDCGECLIDSFTISEYYPWRVGVLLLEACLLGIVLLIWYKVRFWEKSKIIALVVNTSVVVMTCLPMFFLGFNTLGGDDYNFHLSRIATIVNEIGYGHFPVLYQSDASLGSGYLAFVMYGNIFMYVPAFFYALGLPLSASLYAYFVLVNILTTYLAWLCFKNMFTDYRLALVATALYSLAPYRLTNIYSRATAGELIAMAFFPLVMYGVMRIYQSEGKPTLKEVLPLVLGMSGLINCHVLSTEMAAIALVFYALLDIKTTIKRIWSLVLAGVITLFGNLFFLLPFVLSYSMPLQCKYEGLIFNLSISGLTWEAFIRPFIYVEWSSSELRYYAWDEVMVGLPFTIGLIAFVVIFITRMFKKKWDNPFMLRVAILGVISLFLSSRYFPWGFFQGKFGFIGNAFTAVQFPWRYLSLVSLFLAPVAAWSLGEVFSKKGRIIISSVVIGFAMLVTVVFSVQMIDRRYHYMSTSAASALYGDHLYLFDNVYLADLDMVPQLSPEDGAVVVKRGADSHNTKLFEVVSAQDDTWITVPIVAYDYIRATDMATGVPMTTEMNEDTGMLSVHVPEGYSGVFGVDYVVPKSWKLSYLISVIVWLCVAIISFRRNKCYLIH